VTVGAKSQRLPFDALGNQLRDLLVDADSSTTEPPPEPASGASAPSGRMTRADASLRLREMDAQLDEFRPSKAVAAGLAQPKPRPPSSRRGRRESEVTDMAIGAVAVLAAIGAVLADCHPVDWGPGEGGTRLVHVRMHVRRQRPLGSLLQRAPVGQEEWAQAGDVARRLGVRHSHQAAEQHTLRHVTGQRLDSPFDGSALGVELPSAQAAAGPRVHIA